ncbi:hypothetical protein ABTX71_01595 [Streptomyces parvulus]|uniref:hypothetical protein n=1 Tax=Streptomyces parvulus TaxID=146923 RepID=UPI00332D462B
MDKPYIAAKPHECKERAEDPKLPTDERMVWAQLAVAAELSDINDTLTKAARRK